MFEGGFGGFGDFGGMGAMTSPWDFGTGYAPPQSFQPGTNLPVAPPVDLAQGMAASLAQSGIRPGQFMANPAIAAPVLAPPVQPTMNNSWDATPVDMPGGAPRADLPNQQPMLGASAPAAAPTAAPGGEASEASAGGTPSEAAKAKEKPLAERLAEALRGVKAPTPPAVQSIRTPGLPQLGAIKSGEIMALLAAMGAGAGAAGGRQGLPSTLGGALKGQY